jgi:hypothetical protein
VESTEEIVKVATQYYKNLFKYESRPNLSLGEIFFLGRDKLNGEEKEALEEEFTEEEVKNDVFGSYSVGASGLDGISFMFYQKF